jgi:hypothetical protein
MAGSTSSDLEAADPTFSLTPLPILLFHVDPDARWSLEMKVNFPSVLKYYHHAFLN